MEDASSFRIVDVAFAFKAAGVAANREFDFVLRFDGEVESFEGIRRPVGLVVIGMIFRVLEKSEAHFSRLVGRLNGPASALRLACEDGESANESNCGRNDPCYEFSWTHDCSS